MDEQNTSRIPNSDYLILFLIIALAFYTAFIPHQPSPYLVHLDEWLDMAGSNELINKGGTVGIVDPFSGQGIHGNQVFEVGFQLFWAIFHQVSGISWLTIFRYFPAIISVITVLSAYVLGRRQGFGWEAAFFTALIPTTLGLLGPGFLVPVAMGLMFVLLSLFLAFNFRTVRSYLVLLILTSFLVSLHPPTAISLVIILIPYILLNLKGSFKHSLGIALALAVPFLAPFPWIFSRLLPTARSLLNPQFVKMYVDLPALIPLYGYLPVLLSLLGTWRLAIKGGKEKYGLVLGLLAMLAMLATFFTLHYGQEFVYVRGLVVTMLIMGMVAGAGLGWVKNLRLPARLSSRLKADFISRNAGYVLCLILIALILFIGIPARQHIPYYQMIDSEDYQTFLWIKENADESYGKAILDPWKGTAFTAITGRNVYVWTGGFPGKTAQQAYEFLQAGSTNTTFLKNNRISIVYSQWEVHNPDLVEVRKNVYLLKPGAQ